MSSHVRSRRTVLVVDDEKRVRRAVAVSLESHGIDTIEASSGREAIDHFSRYGKRIDAVVLDLVMPGLDGEEVFRELRTWNPEVRVLVSSGHPHEQAIGRLEGQPGVMILHKPYHSAELLLALERLLAEPTRDAPGEID